MAPRTASGMALLSLRSDEIPDFFIRFQLGTDIISITATGRGRTLQYGQPEVGIQAGADWRWWWDESPGFLGPLIPSQWEVNSLRSLQEVKFNAPHPLVFASVLGLLGCCCVWIHRAIIT